MSNIALASAGSTITASGTLGGFSPNTVIDGVRHTNNSYNSGSWAGGGNPNSVAQSVVIDFNQSRNINEIRVYTIQDSLNYNTDPSLSDTFATYGASAYNLYYWNGSAWVAIVSPVTSNNKVRRDFTFAVITTNKIKVEVVGSPSNYAFLVEVEAYESIPAQAGFSVEGLNDDDELEASDLLTINDESDGAGQTYAYKITNSEYTNYVFSTDAEPNPNVVLRQGNNTITQTVTDLGGSSSVSIVVKVVEKIITVNAPTTQYALTGKTAGMNLTGDVRAFNSNGIPSAYSDNDDVVIT